MEKPYGWIKKIENGLTALEERPQFGRAPACPWKLLEQSLSATLGINITFNASEKGWIQGSEVLAHLASDAPSLKGYVEPLAQPFYVSANKTDLGLLFARLAGADDENSFFLERDHILGFFQFATIEIFSHLQKNWLTDFSFALDQENFSLESEISKESLYLIELSLSFEGRTIWIKLLLPESFRASWKRYFSQMTTEGYTQEELSRIDVDLSLEAGRASITLAELKHINLGDFLLVDHPYIELPRYSGRVVVSLEGNPLFRGKVEHDGIRLLSYPIYEEVSNMTEEKESDEDLYGDLESFDEEENEDVDESFNLEEEEEVEALPSAAREDGKPVSISPEEIPLDVTVELSRVRMNASDLLNLSPGDLLDLKVSPEQGVSLLINGRRVFRGELVRVEDLLFVRILSK